MRRIALVLACATAFLGARARADEGEYEYAEYTEYAPAHQHRGFFFHVALGAGGMESRAGTTSAAESASLSGPGVAFNLALGGSITDHLVLGGEVWGMTVTQPDVRVGGTSAGSDSDSDVTVTGWGPTIRFWVAPESLNLYLQATPSLTQVTTRLYGGEGSTRIGLGARLSVGKEWWLGSSPWGIGVAGHLVLSTNKDTGSNAPTWTTVGGGIDFSATWN
jgi:hypothetical protein